MDTCKRMWSENQIGEIAKESGSKLYIHNISMYANETDFTISANFHIYSTSNETYDTLDKLKAKLGKQFKVPATGQYAPKASGSKTGWTVGVYYDAIHYLDQVSSSGVLCAVRQFAFLSHLKITDTITEV